MILGLPLLHEDELAGSVGNVLVAHTDYRHFGLYIVAAP